MGKKYAYFVFGITANRYVSDALAVFDKPKKVEKFKKRFKSPSDYSVLKLEYTTAWFADKKRDPYTLIFDVKSENQKALEELSICKDPHLIEAARVGSVTNDDTSVYIRLMAKSKKHAVKKGYKKFQQVLKKKSLHKEVKFLDFR